MKKWLQSKSLKFEPSLEMQFKRYIAANDKRYIRAALFMFVILYALFSWVDNKLVPEWFSIFFGIRFYIVVPALLVAIAITFHPMYVNIKQQLLVCVLVIGGAGISIMLVFEPLNITYYGGLFLVFTAGYFLLNLNFCSAVFGGFSILAIFVEGVILTGGFSLAVFLAFLFLVSENIIGGVGAYQLEVFRRKEFLNIHKLSLEQEELSKVVHDKIEEIFTAQISTITALANLAESRDHETGEHIERVGIICYAITQDLPVSYFENEADKKEFTDTIRHSSVLHDIGKVAISDIILNKPGPLSDEEIVIMRRHSQIGSETLIKLHEEYPSNLFVKLGIEITRFHHERWDGKGYPDGLKKREIPLSARIMAIADVYDALISKRPYKPAFSHERAIEIITRDAGTHFDPNLVRIFLSIFDGSSIKITGSSK